MNRRTTTRPATPEERAAAAAAGLPVPSTVEVVMTTAADQHVARLKAPNKSEKPAGMETWDWIGQQVRDRGAAARAGQAAMWAAGEVEEVEPEGEPEEVDEDPGPVAVRTSGAWGFRPGGGMFLRTDSGTIVG